MLDKVVDSGEEEERSLNDEGEAGEEHMLVSIWVSRDNREREGNSCRRQSLSLKSSESGG